MTAIVLYNLWQAVNLLLMAQERIVAKKAKGYRVTMPFMVTAFGAHLSGRI